MHKILLFLFWIQKYSRLGKETDDLKKKLDASEGPDSNSATILDTDRSDAGLETSTMSSSGM